MTMHTVFSTSEVCVGPPCVALMDKVFGPAAGSSSGLRVLFVGAVRTVYWKRFCDRLVRMLGGGIEARSISYFEAQRIDLDDQTDVIFVQRSSSDTHQLILDRLEGSHDLSSVVLVTSNEPGESKVSSKLGLNVSFGSSDEEVGAIVFAAMWTRIGRLRSALGDSMRQSPRVLGEHFSRLTPQEIRVVELVQQGVPNKLVAHRLGITVRTVKAHLTHIYRKTGAAQRAELIVKCAGLAQGPARLGWPQSHNVCSSTITMRN